MLLPKRRLRFPLSSRSSETLVFLRTPVHFLFELKSLKDFRFGGRSLRFDDEPGRAANIERFDLCAASLSNVDDEFENGSGAV